MTRPIHLLLLLAAAVPSTAFAHQLDEYLQAALVTIEPGDVRLRINLAPGRAVADQVLGLIDCDRDGIISTNESAAYAESVKRDLVLRLDGHDLDLSCLWSHFPDLEELRTGWGIVRLEYSAKPGALRAGRHTFVLENRHLSAVSAYLFNAAPPGSPSVKIVAQNRDQNQRTGEIIFDFDPPRTGSRAAVIVVSVATLCAVLLAGVRQAKRALIRS